MTTQHEADADHQKCSHCFIHLFAIVEVLFMRSAVTRCHCFPPLLFGIVSKALLYCKLQTSFLGRHIATVQCTVESRICTVLYSRNPFTVEISLGRVPLAIRWKRDHDTSLATLTMCCTVRRAPLSLTANRHDIESRFTSCT